jgi:type II secretory pathway component GspD/PulD (secretin)
VVATRFLPVGINLEVSPTIIGHDQVSLKVVLVHTSTGTGIAETPIAPEAINTATIDSQVKIRSGEIFVLMSPEVSTASNATQLVMLIQASVF